MGATNDLLTVHNPGDAERAYFIAGIISVTLYGLFFLACLWRCYVSFPKFKRSFENKKMIIHVSLTLFGLFQTIYGISFIIHKRDTVWGYSFHMMGQYAVLTSFSLIPLIWTKILSYGGNYNAVKMHIAGVLFGNFVITIIQLGYLYKTNSVYDNTHVEETVTIVRALILSISLLSFSVWLLSYGIRIYIFLSSSQVRSNDVIRTERRRAIRRVLFVVSACSVCYLLRAFCVTLISYDYFHDEYYTDKWFSHLGWYLCSQWIPTIFPACIMLHVCRPIPRQKQPGSHEMPIRSDSFSYGIDGHLNGSRFSADSTDSEIFKNFTPVASMRLTTAVSSSNSRDKFANSSDSSHVGMYFERYSNDMYNDTDNSALYDYDPEVANASTPGAPFTVDEILQSSNKYGASISPISDDVSEEKPTI